MHLFMKFILAPVLFVLSVFVDHNKLIRKYKIKQSFEKMGKEISPISIEKGSLRFRLPFFDMMICLYILEDISSFLFLNTILACYTLYTLQLEKTRKRKGYKTLHAPNQTYVY